MPGSNELFYQNLCHAHLPKHRLVLSFLLVVEVNSGRGGGGKNTGQDQDSKGCKDVHIAAEYTRPLTKVGINFVSQVGQTKLPVLMLSC